MGSFILLILIILIIVFAFMLYNKLDEDGKKAFLIGLLIILGVISTPIFIIVLVDIF